MAAGSGRSVAAECETSMIPVDDTVRLDASRPALAAAYRAHGRVVYRFARWFGGPAEAERLTVDAFLHLWDHPERFDLTRGSLRTGLLADIYEAYRTRSADRAPGVAASSGAEPPDRSHGGLRLLPASEQDAIAVTLYGGCTYREAAIVLNESEAIVKARLGRGLRRLQTQGTDRSTPT